MLARTAVFCMSEHKAAQTKFCGACSQPGKLHLLCAVNDKSTVLGGLKKLEASEVEADASPVLVVPLDADCKAAADAGDDEDWTCLACLVSAEHKTYPKRIAQVTSATFAKPLHQLAG